MWEFTSIDSFIIKGRGRVYTVSNPRDCNRDELIDYHGEVLIDGEVKTVVAVESFAILPQRKGVGLGLLVKED